METNILKSLFNKNCYIHKTFVFKKKCMDKAYDYRINCADIEPSKRLQKCFELSAWAKKTNKYIDLVIQKRLKGYYILK